MPQLVLQQQLKRRRVADSQEGDNTFQPPLKRLITSFSNGSNSSFSVSPVSASSSSSPLVSPEQRSSKEIQVEDMPLEDEVPPKGVSRRETMSPDLYSYYAQRHRYFSKYDEGVWLTDNAWFEVTPEKIGRTIATHIFTTGKRSHVQVILDVFCGVGGNTIQFALSPLCQKVIAIDSDPVAIACARHNARIYGVEKKIDFVVSDFFEFAKSEKGKDMLKGVDAVFLSPPWGGPIYRNHKVFDLEKMTYPFSSILKVASTISNNLAMFLPRTSDLNQLAGYVPEGQKIQAILLY